MRRLAMLLLALMLTGCLACAEGLSAPDVRAEGVYTDIDKLRGRTIGSATGTTYDQIVRRWLPDAKFNYYNTYADMIKALESGKIAAFACDEPVLRSMMAENSRLTMLPQYLDTFEFGYIFGKDARGAALSAQMSEMIRDMHASGELSALNDKWLSGGMNDAEMPDIDALSGENGRLTLAHVLPAYRREIVGLIKATAVVGYIAVQDLTKMGDIVRSRTYEAFFPLIAVTVIYFLLEGLIGMLVSRLALRFDPKRRRPADILRGVHTAKTDK